MNSLLKIVVLILSFFPFVCVVASSESLLNKSIDSNGVPINILDIDGDQNYDALTDGVLILRSLFGLEGQELISGAASDNSLYQTAESIESRSRCDL